MKPAQRRELVQFLRVGFQVSERRACRVIPIPRSSQRYRSQAKDQSALTIRLRDLARSRVRYGYRRLHVLLQREGWRVSHKRVYRLYRLEGLSLRLKTRQKRVNGLRGPKPVATRPNECWSMDFMAERLVDGRRFRVLTFVDNVSRVSPTIIADNRCQSSGYSGSPALLVIQVDPPQKVGRGHPKAASTGPLKPLSSHLRRCRPYHGPSITKRVGEPSRGSPALLVIRVDPPQKVGRGHPKAASTGPLKPLSSHLRKCRPYRQPSITKRAGEPFTGDD